MPRGLSTAAKNYIGPFWWAVKITARDGSVYTFAEDDLTFLGVTYTRNLQWTDTLRLSRSNEASDGAMTLLLDDALRVIVEAKAFNGAHCEVKQLLLGIEEEFLVGTFILREPQRLAGTARFRLAGELSPGGFKVPARVYSQQCTWKFNSPECGYDRATGTLSEDVAQRTASAVGANYIEDSTLAMTVDAHINKLVFVTEGTTGKGQVIRVQTNTATRLTFYTPWRTTPTGTVKFKVYAVTKGAPKPLTTATAAKLETTATGGAARYIEDTGLALVTDEHKGDYVRIISGTGAGQLKKVGSNTTGGRFNLDDAETDFSPAPDGTSVFRVLFGKCTLDYGACLDRAQENRYNGFPTLVPPVSAAVSNTPGGGGGPGGGVGGGGVRGDNGKDGLVML